VAIKVSGGHLVPVIMRASSRGRRRRDFEAPIISLRGRGDDSRGRAGGDLLPGQRCRSPGERGDPAGVRRPSRTRRTGCADRAEASSRMACGCSWSATLTQPRHHRDPVMASHL